MGERNKISLSWGSFGDNMEDRRSGQTAQCSSDMVKVPSVVTKALHLSCMITLLATNIRSGPNMVKEPK